VKRLFTTILIFTLALGISPAISQAQDAPAKKKGHLWLVPVLAGAGFVAGIFVGLSAYDEAINSDQKVWTTAALFGVGGGIAGWLIGRPRAEHVQSYGLPTPKFEIRRKEESRVGKFVPAVHYEMTNLLLRN